MMSFEEKNREGDIHIFLPTISQTRHIRERSGNGRGYTDLCVLWGKALAQQSDVSLFHTQHNNYLWMPS